jgi:hypothetical protein
MANSVKAAEYRRTFKDVSRTYPLAAATDPDVTPLIACQNAKHQLFIQKIKVFVSTSAAQAITFVASTTATQVAILGASAPIGENVVLDSEEGLALPAGENLNVSGSAGVAGVIYVEAYERLAPGVSGCTPADL